MYFFTGASEQAISSESPPCAACGKEDAADGGGGYASGKHNGLFYCGSCWQAWKGLPAEGKAASSQGVGPCAPIDAPQSKSAGQSAEQGYDGEEEKGDEAEGYVESCDVEHALGWVVLDAAQSTMTLWKQASKVGSFDIFGGEAESQIPVAPPSGLVKISEPVSSETSEPIWGSEEFPDVPMQIVASKNRNVITFDAMPTTPEDEDESRIQMHVTSFENGGEISFSVPDLAYTVGQAKDMFTLVLEKHPASALGLMKPNEDINFVIQSTTSSSILLARRLSHEPVPVSRTGNIKMICKGTCLPLRDGLPHSSFSDHLARVATLVPEESDDEFQEGHDEDQDGTPSAQSPQRIRRMSAESTQAEPAVREQGPLTGYRCPHWLNFVM